MNAATEALARLSAALAVPGVAAWREALKAAARSASRTEIDEVLLQAHLFVGFPVVLNAFGEWRSMATNEMPGAGSAGVAAPTADGKANSEPARADGATADGKASNDLASPAGPTADGEANSEPARADGATADGEASNDLARAAEAIARREAGEELCRTVYGGSYERLRRNVRQLHPDLDRWMVEDGYGKTLSRHGLPVTVREVCIVALLAAAGHHRQLLAHLRGALNVGASAQEVRGALEIGAETASAAGRRDDAARARMAWQGVEDRIARS